ncbi:MAG TPA: PIG-L deacetylase family protein [Actinophytocola sp.]|jgi:LmbE family N-acetylglucosaminyl deacetylase|uniref:PIG-L deacetylase family protein n=1 Tax=Actinophytocola sp. TaxID=1872138 RepID=UPI002E04DB51|nr:PIG-L deacetylase family protein [Actinophytocola sp.]
MTTVLAVVAHPDDEVIGPGGTLAAHAIAGDDVHVLILADGKTSRPGPPDSVAVQEMSLTETEEACATLGVSGWRRLDLLDNQLDTYPLLDLAKQVCAVVDELAPEVVYTHQGGDLNVDHELTQRATMIACRPHVSPVQWVFGFPTLSATDAGFAARPPFVPSVFVDVGTTLERKLAAMRCYGSELCEYPHPRSLRAMRAQAELYGAHAGMASAEGFSVLRGTWRVA